MGTETSSTPQSANAGNALTNLFLSNQATPHVATSPLVAPQSMLGQGGQMPPMPSSQSPVSYTPPPPEAPISQLAKPYFVADQMNPGYGTMNRLIYGGASGATGGGDSDMTARWVQNYVSAPVKPQAAPFQPSSASMLASAMNQKYARK